MVEEIYKQETRKKNLTKLNGLSQIKFLRTFQ